MTNDSQLRFALVGTSGHANRVAAPTLAGHPDAVLLGAVGSRPEGSAEFARRHALPKTYASLADVARDPDVEAVWICSPNHLHAAQAAECAAAGKHVLVDKPLATTRADAEAAVAAARAAGVTLRVGYQHRFRPAHRRILELVRGGAVGTLGLLRIHRCWAWPYYEDMDPSGPPAWRRAGATSGGWVINDLGSHLIDLALWWSGGPATLVGAALATQRFPVETEDTAALLLTLGADAVGVVETSAANASPGSRVEIYGDRGWLRADDTLTAGGALRTSAGDTTTFAEPEPGAPYAAAIADFVGAVRGRASLGATGDDGVATVGVVADALAGGTRRRRASLV